MLDDVNLSFPWEEVSDIRLGDGYGFIHAGKQLRQAFNELPASLVDLYTGLLDKHRPTDRLQTNDVSINWLGERWRVHIYHANRGWNLVMRVVSRKSRNLLELGFNNPEEDVLKLARDARLILICGETGAGKSSTLVAISEALARENLRGVTVSIENPVEYLYEDLLVTQREVGVDVRDFSSGVVEAMRETPDTIIIGEIRDRQTAEAAVQAGLTGHRVLATLHASSVEDALTRMWALLDDAHDDLLSNALQGILVQHLVNDNQGNRRLLHEGLMIGSAERNALSRGPEEIPHIAQMLYRQRRKRITDMAETARGEVPDSVLSRWRGTR